MRFNMEELRLHKTTTPVLTAREIHLAVLGPRGIYEGDELSGLDQRHTQWSSGIRGKELRKFFALSFTFQCLPDDFAWPL